MAVTVEDLRQRITRMEEELAEMRAVLDQIAPPEAGAARRDPLAGRPQADKEAWRKTFDDLFKQMGIDHVEPIGAEELQELMRQDGIKAEENLFSRGIIEMREE